MIYHKILGKRFIILSVILILYCQKLSADTPQATTLTYEGILDLYWADKMEKPSIGIVSPLVNHHADGAFFVDSATEVSSDARVLGLRKARFELNWLTLQRYALKVVLRPDALSRMSEQPQGQLVREIDTRAGDVVEAAPTVKFLDSYQIQLAPLAALKASIGVFEALHQNASAFDETLGFGLQVQMPQKMSAFNLSWQPSNALNRFPSLDFATFQGPEDRSERSGTDKAASFDQGLVANDYRQGGQLTARSPVLAKTMLGGTVGLYDRDLVVEGTKLKVSRVYGQFAVMYHDKILQKDLVLGLDSRYALDRFNGSLGIKQRPQYSAQLTTSWEAEPELLILAGLHWGLANLDPRVVGQEITESVDSRGSLIEVGVRSGNIEGVSAQLILSQENRTSENSDKERVGAFGSINGRHIGLLRRIGADITYIFGSRN